jgi:hypothetical protein
MVAHLLFSFPEVAGCDFSTCGAAIALLEIEVDSQTSGYEFVLLWRSGILWSLWVSVGLQSKIIFVQ